MAVVWPSKNNFANGDVLTAANMNNIADTLNVFNPTSATNGQVWTANGSGSGSYAAINAGSFTVLASGNLNTTSGVDLTSISSGYRNLHLYFFDAQSAGTAAINARINNLSGSDYSNNIWANTSVANSTGRTSIEVLTAINASDPFHIRLDFYNYTTSQYQNGVSWTFNNNTFSPLHRVVDWRYVGAANTINRITCQLASGTFTAGTYQLVGAK